MCFDDTTLPTKTFIIISRVLKIQRHRNPKNLKTRLRIGKEDNTRRHPIEIVDFYWPMTYKSDAQILDPDRTRANVVAVDEEVMTIGSADTSPSKETDTDPSKTARPT